jgi:hypothetical protein
MAPALAKCAARETPAAANLGTLQCIMPRHDVNGWGSKKRK